MAHFEAGKLYRWTEVDTTWTLYDNNGSWSSRRLSHQDVFLVLSYKKNCCNLYRVDVLTSDGVVGNIDVHKSYISKFEKLQ